jgi:hypothetical protein
MAQDYPIPRFHFQVDWGGAKISFTEVTGLVMEREKIEYRHSDSKDFNKIAMPGMVKNANITLKRGKFENDFDYNTWLEEIADDFPVKVTAPDLKSDANEIAVESIEVAHEGLKLMKV